MVLYDLAAPTSFHKNIMQTATLDNKRLQPTTAVFLVQPPEQNKLHIIYLYQIVWRPVKENLVRPIGKDVS
jgi:hypothetical protein